MDVAVITGAARGIGLACAQRLAGESRLVLADVDGEELERVCLTLRAAGGDVLGVQTDITDPSAVAELAERSTSDGACTRLVHCAGISSAFARDGREVLDVNLRGTALVVDAFEHRLHTGGVAVCIASIAAYRNVPDETHEVLIDPLRADLFERLGTLVSFEDNNRLAYALAKRGARLICERRAAAWGRRGLRICSVSPGGIDTRMASGSQMTIEDIALRRRGRPEEIAAVIAFLSSPAASYITGVDIVADGGALATYAHHAPREVARVWFDGESTGRLHETRNVS